MSPSPNQTTPSQWSLRSKLEWSSAHKEFYLAAPSQLLLRHLILCSCSGPQAPWFWSRTSPLLKDSSSSSPPPGIHHVALDWKCCLLCSLISQCFLTPSQAPPAHTVRVKPCWYQSLQGGFVHVQALMSSPSPHFPVNKQQPFKCLLEHKWI